MNFDLIALFQSKGIDHCRGKSNCQARTDNRLKSPELSGPKGGREEGRRAATNRRWFL